MFADKSVFCSRYDSVGIQDIGVEGLFAVAGNDGRVEQSKIKYHQFSMFCRIGNAVSTVDFSREPLMSDCHRTLDLDRILIKTAEY